MFRTRPASLGIVATLLTATAAMAQRLPQLAVPEHYRLHFVPDLAAERFAATADLRIRVVEPTPRLVLHAADLDIQRATVSANGIERQATVTLDAKSETATLQVAGTIPAGPADVRISYNGMLNRQLRGFYISEANGRKYAVTQLEATDARRMFPSFDEPAYKATFDISVVVDESDSAIGNGAVAAVTPGPGPGKKTFDFETTLPMSTYLVALAVGDFECAPAAAGPTPLRVCATPNQRHLTSFALEAARAMLEWFNGYFAIDYPFGKLDLIAIPDFAAGAMENTGAIFFRESLLLVRSDAALPVRKRAALVIAHELAHQWFGNLVTMQWWDDLWLNEGFATWMETKAVEAWKPEWRLELDELAATHAVMSIDSLRSTRPVRSKAETPDEINEQFDALAYEKGAAVLGMVESYVGMEAFRTGINAYVSDHKYGNATAEQFWTGMTRSTGKPVDRIMKSFVAQPGVPLVGVHTACQQDRTVVTLTQERFRGGAFVPWSIPVCLETRGDAAGDRCELLETPRATVALPGCARWVIGNANAEGYYHTNHGPDDVARLGTANAALDPDERLMLIADEWALVRAGRSDLRGFLQLIAAMAVDMNVPAVLEAAASRLQTIHEYLVPASSLPRYERWIRDRFGPALAVERREGAGEDSERLDLVLRSLVGGVGRDPEVLADADRRVRANLAGQTGGTSIDPALHTLLVRLAAIGGDAPLFEKYLARAESAATPEERDRFLFALAAFADPALLDRAMDYALSSEVRAQDRASLINAILGNPHGRELAWRRLQSQWPAVARDLGAFGGASRIVAGLAAFCDRTRAAEIAAFFAKHPVPGAQRTLQQTLEDIEQCAALAANQRMQLDEWLAKRTRQEQ